MYAIRSYYEWCIEKRYNYIFEMDADFSHNPNDLTRLYNACHIDGADLSIRITSYNVCYTKLLRMFVQLGMTDDEYIIEDSENMSYRDFVNAFLPYSPTDSVELKFRHALKIDQDDIMWEKLEELDIFSSTKMVELKRATPAEILQKILMEKWTLQPGEKDMIVMYHKFGYEIDGKKKQIDSTMVTIGEDDTYTAMSYNFV